ncbi:hypothetical protein BT67DRAFT_484550 [Trichocladium antarcticum]|uniref:Uncharacterized protein n=1 Tax=Trichocladium antarcticum TaxID=1450529 RepID=A0AAN6UG57_9PEZI|nr:hypothetical protein BT67DRAFT_484550 [Trichocladium antarcticum]
MQDRVYIAGVKLVGVMLALIPNLERFSLQTEGPSAYVPVGALSALTGLSKPGPLAKLTTLDICDRSLPLGFDYHAGGILEAAAGSLATLNVHMSGGPTQKVGRERLRNLRTLRISHTRPSAAKLAALLDSCAPPGLEAFTYEATYPFVVNILLGPADERDLFQPSDAIQPLIRHKATLQSLHLDLRARGYYNPITDGGDSQPLPMTLKDLRALKHVFLSASVLCNHHGRASYTNHDSILLTQLLPTSVTSLFLAGDLGQLTPRLGHALVHLAKSAGPRKEFKALRRVRCDAVLATRGLEHMAVREVFAARGVDFAFSSWPLSEPTRPGGDAGGGAIAVGAGPGHSSAR